MNLFQDFIFSTETKQKVQSDRFATCLAVYRPCSSVKPPDDCAGKLEMTLIPLACAGHIAVLAQALSIRQQGVMTMEHLDTYQFITDKLEDIVFLQDQTARIMYVNESVVRLLGYRPGELINRDAASLYHPEDKDDVDAAFQNLLQGTGEASFEARMRHHHGHYTWIESRAKHFQSNGLHIILTINRDITQRKQTEEQIKFMTFHDSLTGLYNRNYFEQEMIRMAEGRHTQIGLIISDVDCLKFINDTMGHKSGDQLIQAAGETILSSFRASDMVARIGGDEFAVLLPNATRNDLIRAVKRIKKNMQRYNTQHPELPLHLSIGYSLTQKPSFDMHALFKTADDAMYRNKMLNKKRHKSDAFHILLTILNHWDPGNTQRRRMLVHMVQEMASYMKLSPQETELLVLFAKVYNIGLLGLPHELAAKDTPLNQEERALLHKQAESGYRIAQHINELQPIADWIYKQHEWWNGQGYPTGLQGEDIPLPSRIMAVLRAYTAMTTPRPYHPPKSHPQAVNELQKGAGIQFDPSLVRTFINSQAASRISGTETSKP
ncbi:diguanylate cyclase [Desulfovermiculus halophilus]|jgi:diguanylate cyclase (GGDEF)-like protein/PAS domain S-box-containing protein|uniref:diguanylate cyclase n=1 Tax=Desulfovermiculus halophilus TaxID=339722 RepID=UPI00068659DA|nr:diguanylate cyclase [Desulfovermiculus halophilus]